MFGRWSCDIQLLWLSDVRSKSICAVLSEDKQREAPGVFEFFQGRSNHRWSRANHWRVVLISFANFKIYCTYTPEHIKTDTKTYPALAAGGNIVDVPVERALIETTKDISAAIGLQ